MMEKILKRLLLVSIGTLIMVVIIGVFVFLNSGSQSITSQLGGQSGTVIDLVGSRIGTTTTPVYNNVSTGTTTYPIVIGREYDTVDFNIKVTDASSTLLRMDLSVLGSNDASCSTASTTTTMADTVVTSDINWFDLGTHNLNLAGSNTISSGTTTIAWTPLGKGDGKQLSLTGLNTTCVALQVHASGTALYIQANKKNLAR